MKIAVLYSIFAVAAIITNIGTQYLVVDIFSGSHSIELSVFVGTSVGLITKYILDKHWIFKYRTIGRAHEMRTFMLYTAMGLSTTLIFWFTEYTFQYVFENAAMRYLGGVVGLIFGYYAKYRLDYNFVFTSPNSSKTSTSL